MVIKMWGISVVIFMVVDEVLWSDCMDKRFRMLWWNKGDEGFVGEKCIYFRVFEVFWGIELFDFDEIVNVGNVVLWGVLEIGFENGFGW